MNRWTRIGCAAVALALLTGAALLAYFYVSFLTGIKLASKGYDASARRDYHTAIAHYSAALRERIGNDQKAFVYLNRGAAYNFKWRFDEAIRDHTAALRFNAKLSDAYAGRGWAYLRKGDLDKATIDLGEAIKLDPNSQSAYYDRGLIFARRGQLDKALADLDEAVRCSPKSADPLIARGLCYAAKNDLDRALASFDGAIATEPTNAIGYMERSNLYARRGAYDKQERDHEQALRLNPNTGKVSMDLEQWFGSNQWRAWSQEFVSRNAGKDAYQLFLDAQSAYNHGDYEDAITLNNDILAISITPDQAAVATMNRGNAYAAKGDLDKALRDYDEAIALDPKKAGAYVDRALALARRGNVEDAMKDYNEAITLDPQQWQAYFNRAAELAEHGKLREALADLNEVIKLNPGFPGAYVNRANVYIRQSQFGEALRDCTTALEFDPNTVKAYLIRANLSWRKRNYTAALADLQTAVRLKPKNLASALNSLAWFRATCPDAKMRNGTEAVELATKACELSQWKNSSYIDTLAAAHAEAGSFDQAIKYQRQVVQMTKESPDDGKITERLALYQHHKAYREEPN